MKAKLIGFIVILAVPVIFVLLMNVTTTFNITAQVERIEFDSDEKNPIEWELRKAIITENADESSKRVFTGTLTISASSHVVVERVSNGPLTISIDSLQDNKQVGTYLSENNSSSIQTSKKIGITIDNTTSFVNKGQTVLLPLIGKDVTLGIVVNDKLCGSAAILRSGKVTMLGKTILGDVYKVMESTLDAGDQITMKGQESLSYGFVLLDERPALTASYRTIGKYALLSHTGFNSYRMSASWLDLLMKNTFVTALYTILGAIYSIYKLFSKKEKTLYE